jgi:hypothetical protein
VSAQVALQTATAKSPNGSLLPGCGGYSSLQDISAVTTKQGSQYPVANGLFSWPNSSSFYPLEDDARLMAFLVISPRPRLPSAVTQMPVCTGLPAPRNS